MAAAAAPAKILNPATGRMVNMDGKIGRVLVKEKARLDGFAAFRVEELPDAALQRIAELLFDKDAKDAANFSLASKALHQSIFFTERMRASASLEWKVLQSRSSWRFHYTGLLDLEIQSLVIGELSNFHFYFQPITFSGDETATGKFTLSSISFERDGKEMYVANIGAKWFPNVRAEYSLKIARVVLMVYAIISAEFEVCSKAQPQPHITPHYPFEVVWHSDKWNYGDFATLLHKIHKSYPQLTPQAAIEFVQKYLQNPVSQFIPVN